MPPSAKTLREDLARAKAAYAKGDDLRTVQLIATVLRHFLIVKPSGPDRSAIESLLREAFTNLGKLERVRKYLPNGIPYTKGQEQKYATVLVPLAKRIEEDINKETLEIMRERKLRIDQSVIKGTKLLADGNLLEAQRCFRTAVDAYVDEKGLFPLIASRLIDAGHFKASLEYLKPAIEAAPDNARAYDFLQTAADKAEAWPLAEKILLDLRGKITGQPVFDQALAMAEAKLGKWAEALDAAHKALLADPSLDDAKRVKAAAAKHLAAAKPAS